MYTQLTIEISAKKHKAFFKPGFYSPSSKPSPLHKHNYAEIHVVAGPRADFDIDNITHSSSDGNLVLIPPGIFHRFVTMDENTLHTAFQIDCDIRKFSAYNIDPHTILEFFREIENCRISQDYTKLSAYISLFCSYFYADESLQVQPIVDYGFLMHEFLATHYSEDLHLRDLANVLNLSERQTERLLLEHTGNTFREELTAIRINIAKHLLETTDMSLSEVARYVGYHSYAGFWKAMKKYKL